VPDGELEAAAQDVAIRLRDAGQPVTRRTLGPALRAAGHKVATERLGELLAGLGEPADDREGAAA
jgi:hypothetical protein